MKKLYDLNIGDGFKFRDKEFVVVKMKQTRASIQDKNGNKYDLNMRAMVEPIKVDFKAKEETNSFVGMRSGQHFKFKGEEHILIKVNRTRVVMQDLKGNEYTLPMVATIEKLDKFSNMEICKYCRKPHIANDSDLLCGKCSRIFGHTRFSEL